MSCKTGDDGASAPKGRLAFQKGDPSMPASESSSIPVTAPDASCAASATCSAPPRLTTGEQAPHDAAPAGRAGAGETQAGASSSPNTATWPVSSTTAIEASANTGCVPAHAGAGSSATARASPVAAS